MLLVCNDDCIFLRIDYTPNWYNVFWTSLFICLSMYSCIYEEMKWKTLAKMKWNTLAKNTLLNSLCCLWTVHQLYTPLWRQGLWSLVEGTLLHQCLSTNQWQNQATARYRPPDKINTKQVILITFLQLLLVAIAIQQQRKSQFITLEWARRVNIPRQNAPTTGPPTTPNTL